MSEGDWLALLGVKGGPAIYPGGMLPTSNLLRLGGRTIVVDCGAGVAAGIARQGVSLKTIDLIFVTHLHSDHYLDLGPLLHTAWTAGLGHIVKVYGPSDLREYWRHFLLSMRYDIETRILDEGRPDLAGLVELQDIDAGTVLVDGDLHVTAMRNIHPPVIDSFALRFATADKSIVFSGDTAFCPELARFAQGADLLVHEALFVEGVERLVQRVGIGGDALQRHLHASHTPADAVGRIATMAAVKTLAVNHMVPADDPLISRADWEQAVRAEWSGTLHIGTDGMRIPL